MTGLEGGQLRSLASMVPGIVLVLDPDGVVQYANDHIEEVLGFTAAEVVGRNWLVEFVPSEEQERITSLLETAIGGTPTRGNVNPVVTRDGGRRLIQWNDRTLTDRHGDVAGVLAIGVDVTELTTQRRQLQRSEALLAETQRIARLGSWEYDFVERRLWWSDLVFELLGVEPGTQEARYEDFFERIHPDDRVDVDRTYRESVTRPSPYGSTFRLLRPDGTVVWIEARWVVECDEDGHPLTSLGSIQDVSERLELHAQLAVKDAAIESAATPIALADSEFRMTYANPAFLTAWRAGSVDDITSRSVTELWSYDQPSRRDEVRSILRDGGTWRGEVRARRIDGTEFPAEFAGAAIRNQRGETDHVIATISDITDRVEADRVKAEFLSTVSHELRTPLTSIDGALRLVTSGVLGAISEDALHYLEAALRNTRRLTGLIDQLLISDRVASGSFTVELAPHELSPLAVELVDAHRPYGADRQITVRLTDDTDGAVVVTDAERFGQILTNIVSNAIKFSPDGAVVDVIATVESDWARIDVVDRGPGVPPDLHERIFERFVQVDATDSRGQGGTGLGLSISRALAEQLGARIDLESEVGVGSTFSVRVPLSRSSAPDHELEADG